MPITPVKTLHIVSGGPDVLQAASKTVKTEEAAEGEEFYLEKSFLKHFCQHFLTRVILGSGSISLLATAPGSTLQPHRQL